MGAPIQGYNTIQERLAGAAPMSSSNTMPGVYKAALTGIFYEEDNQYIGVKVNGVSFFARPCYGFGAFINLPSAEFLNKYKDEIFAWVMFERNNPKFCVLLGWCFNEDKQNGIPEFPDAAYYRTIYFKTVYDDINKLHGVYYTEKGAEQNIELKKDGWFSKVISLFFTVTNTLRLKSKQTVLDSDQILIGSDKATEPLVKGTALNANIAELITAVSEIATHATTIATASASIGTAMGVIPAATTLTQSATALGTTATKLTQLTAKLKNHLSNKTIVE